MKIIYKIISILMITAIFCINSIIFASKSQAATTYPINYADLYSKGEIVNFKYQGIGIGVEFVVYEKDGVEYPAYCLNKNKPGVTESGGGYTVNIEKVVSDPAIWRAVNFGYPFKTPEQLGCKTEGEAFAATKMAVYDAMYNYDWDDFTSDNASGKRIIAAAEKIAKQARNSKATKITPILKVESSKDDWEVDSINKTCVSKTYTVTGNAQINKYTVHKDDNYANAKVTDLNNKPKKEFKQGEKFKIVIPIKQMQDKRNVDINIKAEMKTRPILYGVCARDPGMQDYAVTAGEYEYENYYLREVCNQNKTKIEIVKLDNETKQNLSGAKFNIYNDKKELVYTDIETNSKGKAFVTDIIPEKYYIKEIKSPDGYTPYEDLVEIDVKLNQTYTLKVYNHKKPVPEEKQVEENGKEVVGKKEIALPRTGF